MLGLGGGGEHRGPPRPYRCARCGYDGCECGSLTPRERPAKPEPARGIVTRELAEQAAAQRMGRPIDYSRSAFYKSAGRRARRERTAAHALGDEAACRLFQRLALGAVLNDRVGDISALFDLPGNGDLHVRVVERVAEAEVADATIVRFCQQGWAWHGAWVRNERLARMFRSQFGEEYVPGAGTARVQAAVQERESGSLSAALAEVRGGNAAAVAERALGTAALLLRNLLREPDNPRLRRVRCANRRVQRRLLSARGGEALLRAVGFTLCEDRPPARSEREPEGEPQPQPPERWMVVPPEVGEPFLRIALETVQLAAAELCPPVEPEPEPEPEAEAEPVATLLLVPGAGVAGVAAVTGVGCDAALAESTPAPWSTLKLVDKHGPAVATTEPYHAWARQHRVSAHTLTSNSVDSVATALAGCRGRLLIAAHSEGGASVVEVVRKRRWAPAEGAELCGVALLDSVHKGPLPSAVRPQHIPRSLRPTSIRPADRLPCGNRRRGLCSRPPSRSPSSPPPAPSTTSSPSHGSRRACSTASPHAPPAPTSTCSCRMRRLPLSSSTLSRRWRMRRAATRAAEKWHVFGICQILVR